MEKEVVEKIRKLVKTFGLNAVVMPQKDDAKSFDEIMEIFCTPRNLQRGNK